MIRSQRITLGATGAALTCALLAACGGSTGGTGVQGGGAGGGSGDTASAGAASTPAPDDTTPGLNDAPLSITELKRDMPIYPGAQRYRAQYAGPKEVDYRARATVAQVKAFYDSHFAAGGWDQSVSPAIQKTGNTVTGYIQSVDSPHNKLAGATVTTMAAGHGITTIAIDFD